MITKKAYKVLKAINYLCSNCSDYQYISPLDLVVYFNNRTKKLDLYNALDYLVSCKLIEVELEENEPVLRNYKPTYRGRHYNEFIIISIKKFIYKSIITPIIVSIITTFIVCKLFS